MKITICMKTPDAVLNAITDLIDTDMNINLKELDALFNRWFRWGEMVNLEVDTVEGTCKVLER